MDSKYECLVGLDPTGQEDNPRADTIRWTRLPDWHGIWVPHTSEPVRTATNAVSVWLRGHAQAAGERWAPFKADFDDFALRRVRTSPPEHEDVR